MVCAELLHPEHDPERWRLPPHLRVALPLALGVAIERDIGQGGRRLSATPLPRWCAALMLSLLLLLVLLLLVLLFPQLTAPLADIGDFGRNILRCRGIILKLGVMGRDQRPGGRLASARSSRIPWATAMADLLCCGRTCCCGG